MGLWGADMLPAHLLFPRGNKRLAGASGSAVHGGIEGCALVQAACTAEGLVKEAVLQLWRKAVPPVS